MEFFGQIGKKISNASQGATKQVKNFTDVARLNSAISDREKCISELYAKLGQAYYNKHKNDPQAEEYERICEINKINAEILKYREEINQIKGVTKCANCGAEVAVNAVFCSGCGAKVLPEANKNKTEQNQTAICPNCQKPVPVGNLFCTHCGTKLEHNN